jgi:acyl carrier protein
MNTTTTNASVITARIRAILMDKLGVAETALAKDASFSSDLGVDSLDLLETFMALEKEFGIKIPDEIAERLTTVGSVIDHITEHAN